MLDKILSQLTKLERNLCKIKSIVKTTLIILILIYEILGYLPEIIEVSTQIVKILMN